MRFSTRRLALCAATVVVAAAVPTGIAISNAFAATDPHAGFKQYSANYKLQNWTNAPDNQRFTQSGGQYNINVHADEKRVEMAWDRWTNQKVEHLWSGDILLDKGSTKTAIMQIKSNTDGEPIYIQVFNTNGDLRNDGGGTVANNVYGKWFHLDAAFNPATGVGHVWINNNLVFTRTYKKGGSGWYFKNGAYNNGLPSGAVTSVHFKNITLWTK
jgi:hypothetical protein